jgi:monoterpene epsilon-lactone hydrolase
VSDRPSSLVLGGDSAGGGLSLATLLALRDKDQKLPARVFCISPWADLSGTGKSLDTNEKSDVWLSRKHIEKWAPWYYVSQDPKSPYVSAVYGSLKNCPPILLMAGEKEVLLDDSTRMHEMGRRDGCETSLHIGKGMQHDWFLSLPWLSESKKALSVLCAFIRK